MNLDPGVGVIMRKSPSIMASMQLLPEFDPNNNNNNNNTGNYNSAQSKTHRKLVKSSIGLGILFCSVVLFVLVLLDSESKVMSEDSRFMVTFPYRIRSHALLSNNPIDPGVQEILETEPEFQPFGSSPALEGLGMLFRKGKRAMAELVVAHLSETTTTEDLRFFLRGLHRSGTPARADIVLLFPWRPLPLEFRVVITEEENSFRRLLRAAKSTGATKLSAFNSGAYTRKFSDFGKGRQEGRQNSIWGSNGGENLGDYEERVHDFGAIVGFDVQELDPEDTLSGFLDSPPAVLRRWLCYETLLGMVRHRYRHVLLVEVTGVFVLHDALAHLKKKDASLHLYYTGERWSDESPKPKTQKGTTLMESVYGIKSFQDADDKSRKVISAGVIMGGTRQVRILATAMATEIVRVALILRKSRTPFAIDAPILSFLVCKSSVLGKKVASRLRVHESNESTVNLLNYGPTHESVNDFFFRGSDHRPFSILQGLNHEGISAARREEILKLLRWDICQSQYRDNVEIYTDCYVTMLPGFTQIAM